MINIKEKSSLLQGKINDQSLVRLIKSPSRMQSFNTILRKQRSIVGDKIIEEKIEESIYEWIKTIFMYINSENNINMYLLI